MTSSTRLPHLVMSSSGAFYVVTSSEHSCPSRTHSRLSERDSRPPISSQSANTDRMESPSRNRESNFGSSGDQQAFQTRSLGLPQHLGDPQPIACPTIGGFASPHGLQGRDLIRLIPQLLK